MINKSENYVEWALLIEELDEAKEHLEKMIFSMIEEKDYEESDFRIDLAHIYAHLNRAWNSRNIKSELNDDEFSALSKFPIDIEPL